MNKAKVVLILFTVLVLVSAASLYENPPANAQVESPEITARYYLKIDDIEGEAMHSEHVGEMDITSFRWGESLPMATESRPGATAGRVAMENFFFSAPVSKASPKLMQSVADGSHFDEAVFTVRDTHRENQPVIMEVKLQDVIITSYHVSGISERPIEDFSLDFGKITYTYYFLDEEGSGPEAIVGSWDLQKNTP
jgi:type VI secretion system secreted protein Hcp